MRIIRPKSPWPSKNGTLSVFLFFVLTLYIPEQLLAQERHPLAPGITVDEALPDIGIILLSDLPTQGEASIYVRRGRILSYSEALDHDTGFRPVDGGYCLYRANGLVHRGQFARVLGVRPQTIHTPARSVSGLSIEFDGGATLSFPGQTNLPANQVLEFCLGPRAQFLTNRESLSRISRFTESPSLIEQYESFFPRFMASFRGSSCDAVRTWIHGSFEEDIIRELRWLHGQFQWFQMATHDLWEHTARDFEKFKQRFPEVMGIRFPGLETRCQNYPHEIPDCRVLRRESDTETIPSGSSDRISIRFKIEFHKDLRNIHGYASATSIMTGQGQLNLDLHVRSKIEDDSGVHCVTIGASQRRECRDSFLRNLLRISRGRGYHATYFRYTERSGRSSGPPAISCGFSRDEP